MFTKSVDALHARLVEYIEATYHIADPYLLSQRAKLLETLGIIRQPAYFESTKSYQASKRFATLIDLLPEAARARTNELVQKLTSQDPPLLYDPPYDHQWESTRTLLKGADGGPDSVVVYTGTGSGKTECFTTPILLRLYAEACDAPQSFGRRAVRALILYPMNALVNDQLARIRLSFGSDAVASAFLAAGGRPVTFGQYTGRTPFSGLRTFDAAGDGKRMKAFQEFYMDTVVAPRLARSADAQLLWDALSTRGKWPAKPELNDWFGGTKYGAASNLWEERLNPRASDRELIARHEFYGYRRPSSGERLGGPPDVLITNYSMLEYMLMRPVEKRIFDETRDWLQDHPSETFFLVLDEAHLYRGAQGTEVALLVRRLLDRLGLSGPSAARVRVAVTSASFSEGGRAAAFASQLVGFPEKRFLPIRGTLATPAGGGKGSADLARALSQVSLQSFYDAKSASARALAIAPVLKCFGIEAGKQDWSGPLALERQLFELFESHPVRLRAVELTQVEAFRIEELAEELFDGIDPVTGGGATESLVSLLAFARKKEEGANLLPSRIHTFHRGLPGLWLCLNPDCSAVPVDRGGGVGGLLLSQPRDRCPTCDSRVFEMFTCRSCGAAYARGYSTDWVQPSFLWAEGGDAGVDDDRPLPVDLLLEPGRGDRELYEVVDLNFRSGIIVGPEGTGVAGTRPIGLYRVDSNRNEKPEELGRVFFRCGVCGDDNDKEEWQFAKRVTVCQSPVEDHQTTGQEPFYALAHEQLIRQPARTQLPKYLQAETPMRGRKLLVFSDGRQKAARLAAELGRASLRDSIRPLLVQGFAFMEQKGYARPLSDAYAVALIAAANSGVQLRSTDDKFDKAISDHLDQARQVLKYDLDRDEFAALSKVSPPAPVATALLRVLRDKHTGLQALALGRIGPFGKAARTDTEEVVSRPLADLDGPSRASLVELWLGIVLENHGCDLFSRDQLESRSAWLAGRRDGGLPRPFAKAAQALLGPMAFEAFKGEWLTALKAIFYAGEDNKGTLRAAKLCLRLPDELGIQTGWYRCQRCSKVQPAQIGKGACFHCGKLGALSSIADGPASVQFAARKRFYRRGVGSTDAGLSQPLVAREHSAQLTGQSGDAHTRAERYELAFQDITAPTVDGMRVPIDVLSCTTTMEVGIDIGSLNGVALRNMPPGRANYQQRAGRAGRRGSGVATVLAYADQDGHNQHFFENPQKLVKAPVPDPVLNLTNKWITRRHIHAYVLQKYLASVVPADADPTPAHANLFASLGSVAKFVGGGGEISLKGLETWIAEPGVKADIGTSLGRWVPTQVEDRDDLIRDATKYVPAAIRAALRDAISTAGSGPGDLDSGSEDPGTEETAVEDQDTSHGDLLLNRLLYEGVLPKYAFPTDLVAFSVFEQTNGLDASPKLRDKVRYAPQRNLVMALSEYAPGKVVFIDGRAWKSGALVPAVRGGLGPAMAAALFVRVCDRCGHTVLFPDGKGGVGTGCPSCGAVDFGVGEGNVWIRPPGFGHPVTWRPQPDAEFAETTRAGRAVLAAPSPPPEDWTSLSVGVEAHLGRADDNELIVTNAGPRDNGFRLCTACGMIEPAVANRLASGDGHHRPMPSASGKIEKCEAPEYQVVRLGTRFRTDVLLIRLKLPSPQQLDPAAKAFAVAMGSLTEALTLATCKVLEIEDGEVVGGYRRGFTSSGPEPEALEIFLYDQLAGGAGYVVEASTRLAEILDEASAILRHTRADQAGSASACDRACYGCLLSFKNSYFHHLLDRKLALSLLEAVRSQTPAELDQGQQQLGYSALRDWLSISALGEVVTDQPLADGEGTPTAPVLVRSGNRKVIPALAHPFSPTIPSDPGLALAMQMGAGLGVEVVPLDYLEVTRALPRAAAKLEAVLRG